MHILDSLLAFSAYFFIGVAMVIIFLFIYSKITPHNEWQLIKNNNTAASLAFSGTLLGNDSNLLIVFYVQIMPDDLVMQLHRF
ncbi:UPF0719 inner membrane protein yjfL [Escherichia coli UMEA 3899-1]|nr:UPF0719 inner membrane protein yjfL [Escherichia coli UMEA 3899-1]